MFEMLLASSTTLQLSLSISLAIKSSLTFFASELHLLSGESILIIGATGEIDRLFILGEL